MKKVLLFSAFGFFCVENSFAQTVSELQYIQYQEIAAKSDRFFTFEEFNSGTSGIVKGNNDKQQMLGTNPEEKKKRKNKVKTQK